MNRYQQALNTLREKGYTNHFQPITLEYQYFNEFKILQELVDKATPKKPIIKQYKNSEHYLCPNCKNYRFGIIDYGEYKNEWRKGSELMLYCPKCGQAIDRSDEDDK